MPQQKEGFKGQRLIAIGTEILDNTIRNALTKSLHITKIGYFPAVKYHYNSKDKGTNYYILMYCTAGEGWYKAGGRKYLLKENQYVMLPPGMPYSFGANATNPWTIYWLHFKGELAGEFMELPIIPRYIQPDSNSRIEYRIQLFEEIYKNLELSYQSNHYCYASLCLYHLLASFKYIEPFRQIQKKNESDQRFSERVIYFMREHVRNNLTLEQLAKHFQLSPSHFSARFLSETKQSPIKYYITLKIEKACEYIEFSNLKISEIYLLLGFQDAAYFSRMFKKVMGVSPKMYRMNH